MNTTHLITTMAVANSHHSGHGDPRVLVATWICINCILLIIFAVRLVMWLMSDRKQSLVDYLFWVLYFDGDRVDLNIASYIFLGINGFSLLMILVGFVAQLL